MVVILKDRIGHLDQPDLPRGEEMIEMMTGEGIIVVLTGLREERKSAEIGGKIGTRIRFRDLPAKDRALLVDVLALLQEDHALGLDRHPDEELEPALGTMCPYLRFLSTFLRAMLWS